MTKNENENDMARNDFGVIRSKPGAGDERGGRHTHVHHALSHTTHWRWSMAAQPNDCGWIDPGTAQAMDEFATRTYHARQF